MATSKIIPLHVGSIEIELTTQQQLFLSLFDTTKHKDELLSEWKKIWNTIEDYEELEEPCKRIMSFIVFRLQKFFEEEEWFSLTKNNPYFLKGLPKYAWTKNIFLLNEFQILNQLFKSNQLQLFPVSETKLISEQLSVRKGLIQHDLKVGCLNAEFSNIQDLFKSQHWVFSKIEEDYYILSKTDCKYKIHLYLFEKEDIDTNPFQTIREELNRLFSWKQNNYLKLLCLLKINQEATDLHSINKRSFVRISFLWICNQNKKIESFKKSKLGFEKLKIGSLILLNMIRLFIHPRFKQDRKVKFRFRFITNTVSHTIN